MIGGDTVGAALGQQQGFAAPEGQNPRSGPEAGERILLPAQMRRPVQPRATEDHITVSLHPLPLPTAALAHLT